MQAHWQSAAEFKEHIKQQEVGSSSKYIQYLPAGCRVSKLKAIEEKPLRDGGYLLDYTVPSTNCFEGPLQRARSCPLPAPQSDF